MKFVCFSIHGMYRTPQFLPFHPGSRHPAISSDAEMWYGYVRCRVNSIHFLMTSLSFFYDVMMKEIEYLLRPRWGKECEERREACGKLCHRFPSILIFVFVPHSRLARLPRLTRLRGRMTRHISMFSLSFSFIDILHLCGNQHFLPSTGAMPFRLCSSSIQTAAHTRHWLTTKVFRRSFPNCIHPSSYLPKCRFSIPEQKAICTSRKKNHNGRRRRRVIMEEKNM